MEPRGLLQRCRDSLGLVLPPWKQEQPAYHKVASARHFDLQHALSNKDVSIHALSLPTYWIVPNARGRGC